MTKALTTGHDSDFRKSPRQQFGHRIGHFSVVLIDKDTTPFRSVTALEEIGGNLTQARDKSRRCPIIIEPMGLPRSRAGCKKHDIGLQAHYIVGGGLTSQGELNLISVSHQILVVIDTGEIFATGQAGV